MTKYLLVNGDPCGGFSFTGPFDSPEDAIAYAENTPLLETWWVSVLEDPES